MALKKPSDLFGKKETSGVFETSEVEPYITESYNKFVDNFETVNEITEKTKVFEKVDELSERVELLSKELSEKLTRTDLENAMLSQLMVLDENFKTIQSQVKGLNKEDLREFRSTVSNLSQVVDNLLETELPKYKNQLVKSKVFVGEQVQELQGIVKENITGIRQEIDKRFDGIAEVIDSNLEYFNNQLQETSSKVNKTVDTYNKISKIVENKVSKENEKLEEYSQVIESLTQSFEELSYALKKELDATSQLSEEKFEQYKTQFENISTGLEKSVDNRLDSYRKELVDVKAEVAINEQHIKNVDRYIQEHHQELIELKEEVFTEIEKLPVGNLQENIKRLENKIDYIKETYSKIEPEVIVKEVIKEGLLNEPPEINNSDPLTPLNQNFVTLDQLQQHYRLFLNRIQQQLSTLGGGGETRLQYLDDIVGIATNPSAYDGKYLKYNHSIGKFEFVTVSGGGGGGSQTLDDTLLLGNTSSLGMSVGVSTFNNVIVGGATTALVVNGDARITGILTIGTSTLTLNGSNNTIKVGTGLTITEDGNANYSGIITASSFSGNATSATYATTAGVSTTSEYSAIAGISTYSTTAGIATYATTAGVSTSVSGGTASVTQLNVSGITEFQNSVYIPTARVLYLGNNNDFQIYHALSQGNSVIRDVGIGSLFIASSPAVRITSSGFDPIAVFNDVGSVELYFNNTKEFETTGYGATVYGILQSQGLNVSGVTTSTGGFVGNLTGNATSATTSGIATYATTAGVSTTSGYATTSGVSTTSGYATTSGVSTTSGYSTTAGIATYATTAGVSTYATNAGIATYSTTAGVSTSVIGGISSVTQLQVTGVSTFTNGPVLVGSGTSTGTASQRLQVTGGGYFSGNVGIGTTLSNEVLSVLPKIQILNNSNADGRLIFRAKPGNAYRWNIDNDGDTNNLRFFKEDDANAANGAAPFQITPTGNATLSGNLNAAGNYYVKLARTSNQTINNGSDTLIGFSAISDGNSWFNSGNNRITPTVAGNYYINAMVKWEAGAATNTVQSNIQIRRNGNTVALSVFGVQTHTYTMNINAIVTMNGSSDYIEFTVYTGNPTSQVVGGDAGGTLTKLEMFKLN